MVFQNSFLFTMTFKKKKEKKKKEKHVRKIERIKQCIFREYILFALIILKIIKIKYYVSDLYLNTK